MNRKIAIVILALASAAQAQQTAQKAYIELDKEGSVPPLPQLYECARKLDREPYDAVEATACLESILASGFFKNGRIETESKGRNLLVRFRLEAPPLQIQKVNFEGEGRYRDQMLIWLQKNGDFLKSGKAYSSDRDIRLANALGSFFQDLGKSAGITRVVDLDYSTKAASLTYRIAIGPGRLPVRAQPPFNPECKIAIHAFSLTNVDDLVPLDLVERMTKTHAFGCFDAQAISEDEDALRKSNLFKEVHYDVQRVPGGRDVSLDLRGQPLAVKEVNVVGYGLLSVLPLSREPQLALQAGNTYSRTAALASLDYLKKKYLQPGQIIEVSEEDERTTGNQIIVVFRVFTYDQDRVVINGKEFVVSPLVITAETN